jgi:hypothetical protein
MPGDELDRALSREEEIVPSSGFTASVMDAVRSEAAVPPPIPFPWRRALPGLAAAGVALILFLSSLFELSRQTITGRLSSLALPSGLERVLSGSWAANTSWIAFGLLVSLLSVKLSMGFARRRM